MPMDWGLIHRLFGRTKKGFKPLKSRTKKVPPPVAPKPKRQRSKSEDVISVKQEVVYDVPNTTPNLAPSPPEQSKPVYSNVSPSRFDVFPSSLPTSHTLSIPTSFPEELPTLLPIVCSETDKKIIFQDWFTDDTSVNYTGRSPRQKGQRSVPNRYNKLQKSKFDVDQSLSRSLPNLADPKSPPSHESSLKISNVKGLFRKFHKDVSKSAGSSPSKHQQDGEKHDSSSKQGKLVRQERLVGDNTILSHSSSSLNHNNHPEEDSYISPVHPNTSHTETEHIYDDVSNFDVLRDKFERTGPQRTSHKKLEKFFGVQSIDKPALDEGNNIPSTPKIKKKKVPTATLR